ncbi:hypothetical protein [Rivibacter subsaxonicus]|uniref:Uncharacterized protein n=1 Tax=Rivibacter subsaxonicus TaxID=457575 RepID=A0A4Q7VN87_9BURK|nr:hypothetical protein [Rivibacter subsaxonicus]RZT97637.1 hypothetical protein EV670_2028 [Rivibacter subsaxonicus]
MKRSHLLMLALASGLLAAPAWSKLPPPSPEAKLKADEARAKTAWSDKVANYQLCKSMDRTAAHYQKSAKAAGKDVKPPTETPACADPGPFVPPAPPLEAAGAHSPTTTAASPPSTTQTAAQQATAKVPAKPASEARK